MNKTMFLALDTQERVRRIKESLMSVLSPEIVFGEDAKRASKNYKKLIKQVHPDVVGHITQAEEAAQRLNELWAEAENAISTNTYGKHFSVAIKDYYMGDMLGVGDIASVWEVKSGDEHFAAKIVRDPLDNDLMLHESHILKKLTKTTLWANVAHYYPELVETVKDNERLVNIFSYSASGVRPSGFRSLNQISRFYGETLNVKHIGWIWRRLLTAMAHIHNSGIVHGAITPDNILIAPKEHGLVLIDWIHSTENGTRISTISEEWRLIYPAEVFSKANAIPATDIYMAAKCMLLLCPHMPQRIKTYFEVCTNEIPSYRPDRFSALLENFDTLIFTHLGWAKEFVPMDDFIDWTWFHA